MLDYARPVGDLLREWRRRLSRLELACEACISTPHLSFVETGRALPSRDVLLRLADELDVPVREFPVAVGYAPVFPERSLADPALAAAHEAIELIPERQKPYPAFALDRHWRVVASNAAMPELYADVAPELLEPPIDAITLSLHPRGLAPHIAGGALHRGLERARREAPPRPRRPDLGRGRQLYRRPPRGQGP